VKTDSKKNETSNKPTNEKVDKPKGRSFCCSIFIYTFVFIVGVIIGKLTLIILD
jgi:hypothetical protein